MKIKLELNVFSDDEVFLNFWDASRGDDVVCKIVDGKLVLVNNEDGRITNKKITLAKFVELVRKAARA